MGAYQKESKPVKPVVQVIDQEAVIEKASQGLLALSLEIGLDVIVQLMENEVGDLAGEKGKHDKDRIAYRHGKEQTKVAMGGKKAAVDKPRVRAKDGSGEIALDTLSIFQKEDPLDDAAPSRLLAGASCRKYVRTEQAGPAANESNTSKSEVARRFKEGMKTAMGDSSAAKYLADIQRLCSTGCS
ncbi:MAG: hypothetical protein FWG10_09230 [Eubacteriaceae bacterium]|nr:hypothetical protein [Eubacteriaceae bacterium]